MLDVFPTELEVRVFLDTRVGGRQLQHYAVANDLSTILWLLIQAAGKVTPPFLAELVTAFGTEFAHDPAVQAFTATLAAPEQRAARAVAAPYYACFIANGPFVDREDLRPALERLHAPKANAIKKPRILVVAGGPSSGKTHTKFLVNHLGESFGFQPAIVDFSRWAGELKPEDLGQRIASRLLLPGMPTPGNEQIARWSIAFFDSFVPALTNSERWLVIDFGRVSISTAVAEFVDELATQIADSLPKMRLVLLGYAKPLTTTAKRILEQDDTKDITARELSLFFAQFYQEYGPELEDEELGDRIAGHVPKVLAKMAEAGVEGRYAAMEEELASICDAIGKEA